MLKPNKSTGGYEIRARRSRGAELMRELDRDARMPKLLDLPDGSDLGERVRALNVVVVGVGSIGSYFADQLARLGVAELLLIDRDNSKSESVLTHPIQPRDIGSGKAITAGQYAKAISPATRVYACNSSVEDLPLDVFVDASAVLLASDNLACEREVSQICKHLGLPLIQASVHGSTLVAQVRSIANQKEHDGPCLTCDYQAADWKALNEGTTFSCTGGPTQVDGLPTVSPPQLCATAASLAVTELLNRCTGIVAEAESRLITYCGYNHQTTVTPLERRDGCPSDHSSWHVAGWDRPLLKATPRELFAVAGCKAESAMVNASMTVAGYRFCRLAICGCSEHPVAERFKAKHSEGALCVVCGDQLESHPFYTYEVVPGKALIGVLDASLEELGVDGVDTVLVQYGDKSVLIHARQSSSRKEMVS
jgi:molybdopterin/thiamine biosynthesis adenylyltransferase